MSRTAYQRTAWMIGVGCVSLPAMVAAQEIWHVDASACPDAGSGSLQDPFCDLQDGLAVAEAGDEIRVAEGVYMPADRGGERTATFLMIEGVTLRGGYPTRFEGSAAISPQPERFLTVLSGDLDRNDPPGKFPGFDGDALVAADATPGLAPPGVDNAYHVVTARAISSDTVLDGFVITAGNADGPWFPRHNSGGGMFLEDASPTVTDCRFIANAADFDDVGYGCGGAMYCLNSSPIVTRCMFVANSAGFGLGGGVFAQDGDVMLSNCVFIANRGFVGGGVYNLRGHMTLSHCTLADNDATSVLGHAVFVAHGTLTILHSIVWDWGKGPNAVGSIDADVRVRRAVVKGGIAGKQVMDADPGFVDPSASDFRLQGDSLCIDAGDPGWRCVRGETDVAGHPRLLGLCVDLGAYEFGMGDYDCDRDVDLADFAHWRGCVTGPSGQPYPDPCVVFDFRQDGCVDLHDFAELQTLFAAADSDIL